MRRAALAFLLLAAAGQASAAPAPRAVWIWEKESYAIVEDTAAASAAIDFLSSKNINTLYLYADAYGGRNLIAGRPDLYRALIRRLHARGMRAYALLGSAYLHTEEYVKPERRKDALAMFRRVLDYNARSARQARFDGVNLDIEPHILDEWNDATRERLLLDFLDLGRALMRAKRAAGADLAVGPAMPFWLDNIFLKWRGRKKAVSEHTQDIYDYVALMDYRDHAAGRDGMLSHAADEMKYAALHGKKTTIGVETTPGEPEKISFNHLTEAEMERELGIAEAEFRKNPAFAGFVLHHYRGYITWLEAGRQKKTAAPGSGGGQ